jgi:hypothetical protein
MKKPILAILFVAAFAGATAIAVLPGPVANWFYCRGHIENVLEVGPRLSWALDRDGTWRRRLRAGRNRHSDC